MLFNGGAMTPTTLRDRVLDQLAAWHPDGARPRRAGQRRARAGGGAGGGAYYGLVRRGLAARIRGGTPRAFYVGVDGESGAPMAVCLAPKGLDEGSRAQLDRDFALVTNRPVRFKLFSSSARADAPGALVPVGDGRADTLDDGSDLLELPPIVTVLRAPGRSSVDVRLQIAITELGALEVWCVERDRAPARPLAADLRHARRRRQRPRPTTTPPRPRRTPRRRGPGPHAQAAFRGDPAPCRRWRATSRTCSRPAATTGRCRRPRALFDALVEVAPERKRSADHEQRWLNLAGFCLRPGTGAPLDAWRAKQMWGVFNEGLVFGKSEPCRLAWWIVWRRIAGGLIKTQQDQIYDRLARCSCPTPGSRRSWPR